MNSRSIHMGEYISQFRKKHRKGAICKYFVKRSRKAYTECGKYLARRMPLLRISSSVDSRARGTITCQLVKKLSHVLYFNLTSNELTQ